MYSDRDPVLCKYTGAVRVVVQILRAPVYPGCGMHICGLVRHGCVEWGLVSTQDRQKYKHRFRLSLYSVCIRFVFGLYSVCIRFVFGLYFPYKTKVGMYYIHTSTQYTSTYTAASGYNYCILIVTKC